MADKIIKNNDNGGDILFKANVSGTETTVMSISGSTGAVTAAIDVSGVPVNYVSNSDAEGGVSGWTIAGSATLDNTGAVLRGTKSFRLYGTAAGTIETDLVIQEADANKLMRISCDIKGLGIYAAGDVKVEIVDPGSLIITPRESLIPAAQGLFQTDFASAAAGTYKLRFTVVNTLAAANALLLDDIQVNAGSIVTGAIVGAWQSFTLDVAGSYTFSTQLAEYRRVGTNMEVRAAWTATSIPGGVNAEITIPGSLNHTGDNAVVGTAFKSYTGTDASIKAITITGDTTTIGISDDDIADGTTRALWNSFSVNGTKIGLNVSIPIAEWAGTGTVNLISDSLVNANARFSTEAFTGTTTVINTTQTTITTWNTPSLLTGGMTYDASTGEVTVPSDGQYQVIFTTGFSGYTPTVYSNARIINYIAVDGTDIKQKQASASSRDCSNDIAAILTLVKGNKVKVNVYQDTGGTRTLVNSAAGSFFSVTRLSDYTAGEPVGFGLATAENAGLVKRNKWQMKTLTATTTSDATANTALTFNNLIVGNTYRITCAVLTNGVGAGYGQVEMKQGSVIVAIATSYPDTGNNNHSASGTAIFVCTNTTLSAAFSKSVVTGYFGSSTTPYTYAILEEIHNYEDETTDFS